MIKNSSLKILAIGNSFSVDAMQWLYGIAKDGGFKKIVLGNSYIGGCSLATHWDEVVNNKSDYTYAKNTNGAWLIEENKTMLSAILDEDWDIITLQQASGDSGVASTYEPFLSNLINYINTNKTKPDVKLMWHMTWAYQADSTHRFFPKYNNNQLIMYNAIVSAVNKKIVGNDAFSKIIPAGTAIQNVRTSIIGDNLTHDGFHLSPNIGRYIAGMTWYHKITGLSVDNITYVPDAIEIPRDYLCIVKKAVKAAVDKPFDITYIK